jgi:hypothetical protein
MKLITHLCIVPRLKMNGAIPPLAHVVIVCAGTILALAEQLGNRNVEAR